MQGINPTMLLWFINHLHNFFVLYPAAFIRCRASRTWHSPSQDKFMTGASPRSHCSSCLSDPWQPLHITPASRVAKIQTYLSQLFCLFLSFKQWGPDLYQSSTCKSETESQSHHHRSTLLPVSQGLHLATAQHLDIEIHATAKPSPRSHRVKKQRKPQWLFTAFPSITATHCMQASNVKTFVLIRSKCTRRNMVLMILVINLAVVQ